MPGEPESGGIGVDDPVSIYFSLIGNNDIGIKGRIVRKTDTGFAVKFRDMSKTAAKEITRYIG